MSKPKKQVIVGPCMYCGQERQLEEDHVVPTTLFINQNQSTVKVLSCRDCNVDKSAGEGDLRDFMVLSQANRDHPTARKLLPVVADATRKGVSQIGLATRGDRRLEPQYTNAGVYLGHAYKIPVYDPEPMHRSLRYIVRGLFAHVFKERFPADEPHDELLIPEWDFHNSLAQFAPFSSRRTPNIMGRGEFWWDLILSQKPGVTGWLMVFYDHTLVVGSTGLLMDDDEDDAVESFHQVIRKKGRRERALKRIVDRRIVHPPPDNILEALGGVDLHEDPVRDLIRQGRLGNFPGNRVVGRVAPTKRPTRGRRGWSD